MCVCVCVHACVHVCMSVCVLSLQMTCAAHCLLRARTSRLNATFVHRVALDPAARLTPVGGIETGVFACMCVSVRARVLGFDQMLQNKKKKGVCVHETSAALGNKRSAGVSVATIFEGLGEKKTGAIVSDTVHGYWQSFPPLFLLLSHPPALSHPHSRTHTLAPTLSQQHVCTPTLAPFSLLTFRAAQQPMPLPTSKAFGLTLRVDKQIGERRAAQQVHSLVTPQSVQRRPKSMSMYPHQPSSPKAALHGTALHCIAPFTASATMAAPAVLMPSLEVTTTWESSPSCTSSTVPWFGCARAHTHTHTHTHIHTRARV